MTTEHEFQKCRLGDIDVDLPRQRVERDGVALEVSGLSFQLLRYLIAQGDRVVGFDELISQVWAPAVVNEETVTQRVKLLRQALGDDSRRPRYIRSVRGQGYQLCDVPQAVSAQQPDSEMLGEQTSQQAQSTQAASAAAEKATHKPQQRWAYSAAAGLVVLAVAGGAGWWMRSIHAPPADPAVQSASDEVLQRAAYYASIGQRDDNERAIVLYERVLKESPNQSAAQLGLSRAYSARVCLFNFPPEWASRAQELADAVIRAQPQEGPAYAARGYSYDCRGVIDLALKGYERAIALDPTDDKSRASAGYLYERKGRLADALKANTGVKGDPARVRFLPLQLASNLELLGYPQAAEARYRRSFDLYPDNVFSNIAWPRFLLRQGRQREAQAALEEALQRGTAHVDLFLLQAELALSRGDHSAAREACRKAVALRPQASLPTSLAAIVVARPDQIWLRKRADGLAQALQEGAGYPGDWIEVALLHEAAGDHADALSDVSRAVAGGYRDAAYLQTSPWLSGLRDQPGFAAQIDAIQRALVSERARVSPQLIAKLTATP